MFDHLVVFSRGKSLYVHNITSMNTSSTNMSSILAVIQDSDLYIFIIIYFEDDNKGLE